MGNKARRLAYSKYHPIKQTTFPEKAKQEILFGIDLETMEWKVPANKGGKSRVIKDEEASVSLSNHNRFQFSFRSKYFNEGDKVAYLIIGDKLLIRKGAEGYLVGTNKAGLMRFAFNYSDENVEQFKGKIYPLHKYDEVTFFITKSEGR